MAPSSGQMPAASSKHTLLNLIPELQLQIISHLKFPDIALLRATCKYFRKLLTRDQLKEALLALEDDLHDILCACIDDDDVTCISLGVEKGLPQTLVEHPLQEASFLPCFGCLQLVAEEEFDSTQSTGLKRSGVAKLASTRRCLTCMVNSEEALIHGTQWLAVWGHFAKVRCTSCLQVQDSDEPIPIRQAREGLCTSCWKQQNKTWYSVRELLRQEVFLKQRQLQDMQNHDNGNNEKTGITKEDILGYIIKSKVN